MAPTLRSARRVPRVAKRTTRAAGKIADWNPLNLGYNWQFDHDLYVNTFKVGVNYHFNNIYNPLK
jgi:hypothetical protein